MAERILRVPFAEATTVRLNCKKCGESFIELPVSALPNAVLTCPGCGVDLRKRPGVDDDLRQFANGFLALQKQMEIGIGFVLSESEGS